MSQQLWEEIVKGVSVSSRKVQPSLTLTRVNSKPSITLPTWRALPKDRFEDSTDLQVLDQLFSPLSSLSSDSFLINLRLHPFALFQDFLLLARPPPLPPPPPPSLAHQPWQHGRPKIDQRAASGRFVLGFFKFHPVRPVDWSVKTGAEDGRDPGPAPCANTPMVYGDSRSMERIRIFQVFGNLDPFRNLSSIIWNDGTWNFLGDG